ncbi:hypothetical protein [Amycolatopsis coloradensis]|nr:hypothetical protein [Amycolatopsis coloradensis]
MGHQDDVETEGFPVNLFPARQAMLPVEVMQCLPLSQRLRELFLVTWVPVLYGVIAINVVVLMLLGVDILVAEAVAVSVCFATTEMIRRTIIAGALGGTSETPGPLGSPATG